ncbi:MAG: tRNA (N(6)-L-threonylcarbamoyladenosine(37)-C(2))-methylthiotransferase MtaB [Clostridia bacterium]|nr:tRNA (N(6)-L-threonylcarbamoyladenosine(37)-C(2))-methylthiotransferase MtaB [Clostridia bacterium]
MRFSIITLGCRVNQYESDAMAELLEKAGHIKTEDLSKAELVIVNSCTVTNIADRKSRQMISKAHRLSPNAKLIAAGCWSQRSPEQAAGLEGVDAVIGSTDKAKIVGIAESLFSGENETTRIIVKDVMHDSFFEPLSAVNEGRTRAYLKIQDGCNLFCTYCAIPFARGALRSRSLASVREELEKLNERGYPEVVLTGIHLMSYGVDLKDGTTIADAVKCFGGLDNIKRIRFGSLEPHLMIDGIIEELAGEPRVCRQFHLSLQSGSDTVLDRMKRGYTSEQYYQLVQKLRQAFGNETAITTDLIAGFPGETEEEHLETIAFMKKIKLAKTHVFPYSRRSGTKADRMPGQLTNAEKARRAGELIKTARALEEEYLSRFEGSEQEVLIEEKREGCSIGHTDTYVRVKINGNFAPNSFVRAIINGREEDKDGELSLLSDSVG